MRMSHYFLALLVLALGGLVITAAAGVMGASFHLTVALGTAFVVVGLHSLVILFVLIAGRLLREGHENCGLDATYIRRSNEFFRERGGFYLALLGAFSIVAAGVLGYTHRAFSLPPAVHLFTGLAALVITFVAAPIELRALRKVEALLDEARELLDREDAERAERGEAPLGSEHEPQKDSPRAIAGFVALAPLLVYLYQVLIVWRGDFGSVSPHPWLEISALGAVGFWFALRVERGSAPGGGGA